MTLTDENNGKYTPFAFRFQGAFGDLFDRDDEDAGR